MESWRLNQVPIWFERKFEFSSSLDLLPNLRARLRGTPARLEEALRDHSREILTRNRKENGRRRNTPVTCWISKRYGWRAWRIT